MAMISNDSEEYKKDKDWITCTSEELCSDLKYVFALITYSPNPVGRGPPAAASSGSPSAASRSAGPSALAPTCDAGASGSHKPPDSAQTEPASVSMLQKSEYKEEAVDVIYLDLLNDGLELRRAVDPVFQQLHALVKVLHVLRVHLEEGCEFLQDVSDARCGRPAGREIVRA